MGFTFLCLFINFCHLMGGKGHSHGAFYSDHIAIDLAPAVSVLTVAPGMWLCYRTTEQRGREDYGTTSWRLKSGGPVQRQWMLLVTSGGCTEGLYKGNGCLWLRDCM